MIAHCNVSIILKEKLVTIFFSYYTFSIWLLFTQQIATTKLTQLNCFIWWLNICIKILHILILSLHHYFTSTKRDIFFLNIWLALKSLNIHNAYVEVAFSLVNWELGKNALLQYIFISSSNKQQPQVVIIALEFTC